jgi:hypothetical protein
LLFTFVIGIFINWKNQKEKFKEIFSYFKTIHYAWIVLFIAILNFGKTESTSLVASNSVQIGLVLVSGTIIGFSLISRFYHAFSAINMPLFCLVLYGFSGILSGAISPFPAFSVYKAFLILIGAMAGMLFLSYRPVYRYATAALDLSISFYWVLFLFILLGGIISPEKAFINEPGMTFPMIRGWIIKTNSNGVAMIIGVLALVCINRVMRSQPMREKLFYLFSSFMSVAILLF